jgi:release factor glutamine methyltransferase
MANSVPVLDRVERALTWARTALAECHDAEPTDGQSLLGHVLGADRATLIAHPERPLTPDEAAQFRALIERRAAGEPVAYLTGRRAFYDREFIVTPDVLIPRPETEHLVDEVLNWARGRENLRIADVGTGCGPIAVTLAAHLPGAHIWALDESAAALAIARQNADLHGVADRITFLQGDILAPLLATEQTLDVIAANLPYIPVALLDTLAVSKHEPRLALDGGPDGLVLLRRFLAQAPVLLAAEGLVLLEIMAWQGETVTGLAEAAFPGANVRLIHDLAGHDRLIRIERRG